MRMIKFVKKFQRVGRRNPRSRCKQRGMMTKAIRREAYRKTKT